MTDEPYAERELRAALSTLLVDEPSSPPVVDDVNRGRALRRRHRARFGAVAGVAVVIVGVVAAAGLLRPSGTGAPVGGSPTAPRPVDQVEAVTAELDRLGFTVTATYLASAGDDRSGTVYAVRPSAAAPGSFSAALTVRAWRPADAAGERTALPGAVMNGCDGTTCTASSSDGRFCQDGTCWGQWSATTTAAYASQVPGSLVVFLADGDRALEGVATPLECPTCSRTTNQASFLTPAQLRSVLLAAVGRDAAPSPAPSGSADAVRACRGSDVKLIPAIDPEQELFARSLVVEVHARNPEVRCEVAGYPELQVRGAAGELLAFDVVQSRPPGSSAGGEPVLVTQASTPSALLTVTQGRCTVEARVPASVLLVTLPGEGVPITVELPAGLAPVACPGGPAGSRTLSVTAFAAP